MMNNTNNPRMIMGIVIIVAGALLLLSNFDIIDYDFARYIFRWQTILIVIGMIILGSTHNKSTGVILISIGLLGYFPEFWPLVLVLIGLYMIFRTGSRKSVDTFTSRVTGQADDYDFINEVAIFGGGKKYIKTEFFRGGKLTAIFGGSEIDLIDSKLAQGEQVLDIFAMFGGMTILIPSDWKIDIDILPIFGGYSDNRRKDPNLVQRTDRVLKIKGLVLFGGGEIKN